MSIVDLYIERLCARLQNDAHAILHLDWHRLNLKSKSDVWMVCEKEFAEGEEITTEPAPLQNTYPLVECAKNNSPTKMRTL
jgi:hypothetical protein